MGIVRNLLINGSLVRAQQAEPNNQGLTEATDGQSVLNLEPGSKPFWTPACPGPYETPQGIKYWDGEKWGEPWQSQPHRIAVGLSFIIAVMVLAVIALLR